MTLLKKNKEELLIRKVLDDQIKAWNRGDLEQYMSGYWKSDSLRFIGKKRTEIRMAKHIEQLQKNLS
jgi:hypothetical protein